MADRAVVIAVAVVLPGILVALQYASSRTDLKLLLFPPLAAIGYHILREPHSPMAHLRSVVLAPTLASACGVALTLAGGLQAWTVAAATLAAVVIVESLRAHAPPALAVALLALFGRESGWTYPVSVLLSTSVLYVVWLVWRRIISRLQAMPDR